MSETLKILLEKWAIESVLFRIKTKDYMTMVSNLSELNDLLNKQIKEEGLDIKTVRGNEFKKYS